MIRTRIDATLFSSDFDLSTKDIHKLIEIINSPVTEPDSVLGGRSTVVFTQLENTGPVVVKFNTRGGLIRHFVTSKYTRIGKTNNQVEFEYLKKVRKLGVNAPEPVMYITQGFLFYKGFLITKEIKNSKSLVEISFEDEKRANLIIENLTKQMNILLDNKIHHVDLHPGNILVTPENKVYIIDFNKAHIFIRSRKSLVYSYIARWERAIKKHKLPPFVSKSFKESLSKYNF